MNEYGHVYVITNTINGKVYVGQAITTKGHNWRKRCRAHFRSPENEHLSSAMAQYGLSSFTSESFAIAMNKEELDELEIYAINEFQATNPEYGYNMRMGGSNAIPTLETRARMSASRTGRVLTAEHRLNISAALKGQSGWSKGLSGEHTPHYGHKHSEETRKTISAKNIGRIYSNETKIKMSESQKTRTRTPEHRAHMSAKTKSYWERIKREKEQQQ